MRGEKRNFEHAVEDATSAASGPASGSLDVIGPYPGSRRLRQRFKYKDGSRSAFVELVTSWKPSPEQFKANLAEVPGVVRVEWNTSKESQGNPSHNRYCPQNILVYSEFKGPDFVSRPIEFVLTTNDHMKKKTTVTAMFKDPPPGMIGEAWRILLAVTNDKQLLPEVLHNYWQKHVARWENDAPVSDSAQSLPALALPLSDSDVGATVVGPFGG